MILVLRIGFDIDGVLCSILPECLEAAKKVGLVPSHIQLDDIHGDMRVQFNWPPDGYSKVFTEEFTMSLPPKLEVINDVRRLIDEGHYIIFITSRPITEHKSTIEWLKKYNLLDGAKGVIHEKSDLKYLKAQEYNLQIFIDDYPKVIKTMVDVIEYPFLLEGPINNGYLDSHRYSWEEISEKINQLSLVV